MQCSLDSLDDSISSMQAAKQLLSSVDIRATEEELQQYFATADKSEGLRIGFAEFLTAVAIIVLHQATPHGLCHLLRQR